VESTVLMENNYAKVNVFNNHQRGSRYKTGKYSNVQKLNSSLEYKFNSKPSASPDKQLDIGVFKHSSSEEVGINLNKVDKSLFWPNLVREQTYYETE